MRPTFAQIAAGILILSAGAAVVVLPGRVFGPERVTAPLALPKAQPVAVQARPVKAPVKHRVVTAPVSVAPVVTRAVHVSAPPSKPTTVVHRTVAPRHVVQPVSKQPKVTPKPAKPKPTPPPPTTTTPTPTIVPATTPPTLVAAATPPSSSSVVSPKTDTTPQTTPQTPPQTPPPAPDQGNGKDHGNGHGHDHGNGHGHGHGQNT